MINKIIIALVAAALFHGPLTAKEKPNEPIKNHVVSSPEGGSEMAIWRQGALFASEQLGLVYREQHKSTVMLAGQFEYLALHDDLALTYDTQADQIQGIRLSDAKRLPLLPKRGFHVEWLCLQPRAADSNLYAWIGDDAGHAEQWLLSSKGTWKPQLVRSLAVSMGALKCVVDDEQLYVLNNQQGLWRYLAATHMPASSQLVSYLPDNHLSGLALSEGHIIMMGETGQIYDTKGDELAAPFNNQQALESLYIKGDKLWAYSDNDDKFYQAHWQAPPALNSTLSAPIPEIPAAVESDIADRAGDTMDDPAIWIHPTIPEKSRILGTNKRWGLLSFSMQGKQLQAIAAGRVNNVDIKQQVKLGGQYRDIAVASNRDHNSLSIFSINPQGMLTQLPDQPTTLTDIYGLCLYQPNEDELYVFANEKSGRVSQLALHWQDNQINATIVREFSVPSQPEGCVADDRHQRLYLGEENVGVWMFDLSTATKALKGDMVIKAGGPLVADIEGIALYQRHHNSGYLVISSQGNDSYVLYNSHAPYAYVGRFRIGNNADHGIDGSAETDGLDVTAHAVGAGVWSQGMMVVQDGRNRMPEQNQNFKWVPWQDIAKMLQLPK